MKKLLTVLAVTALGFAMATVMSVARNDAVYANPAADECIKTQKFDNGKAIQVNPGGNAKALVKLDDGCGKRTLALKSWYAPSATGEPHAAQRKFAETVQVFKASTDTWEDIKVDMPEAGCFYQVDLVDVTKAPPVAGDGYPIVAAVTGGNHDCTPTKEQPQPVYSCDLMPVNQAADRKAVIGDFKYTAKNATLSRVLVTWGDGSSSQYTNPSGAVHPYAKDATYSIQAVAYFNVNGSEVAVKVNPACGGKVSFAPVTPGKREVCEIATQKIVEIPEGPYDTSEYAPKGDAKCNPTTTVSTSTKELPKTGPGSMAALFGAISATAAAGRYAFLRRRASLL